MLCPLCKRRPARRGCPALGHLICTVCCGTKRLSEIRCTPDCGYLVSARTHPPAVERRQQAQAVDVLRETVADLTENQQRLLVLLLAFIARERANGRGSVVDRDLVDAVDAVAATLETSARGVIYEHRPASLPAQRLAASLKEILTELGANAPTSFTVEAAVVLRSIEQGARRVSQAARDSDTAYLDLVAKALGVEGPSEQPAVVLTDPGESVSRPTGRSSLIVP